MNRYFIKGFALSSILFLSTSCTVEEKVESTTAPTTNSVVVSSVESSTLDAQLELRDYSMQKVENITISLNGLVDEDSIKSGDLFANIYFEKNEATNQLEKFVKSIKFDIDGNYSGFLQIPTEFDTIFLELSNGEIISYTLDNTILRKYPTTIKNFRKNLRDIDSDNDSIIDSYDMFPSDKNRAFLTYYPFQNSKATILFEDNYPKDGDMDLNDLVVPFSMEVTENANGDVVEILMDLEILASGANYNNSLSIKLDANFEDIDSVTLNNSSKSFVKDGNGVIIDIVDNIKTLLGYRGNGTYYNTQTNLNYIDNFTLLDFDGDKPYTSSPIIKEDNPTFELKITFKNPQSVETIGQPPYNIFMRADNVNSKEIHLVSYPATLRSGIVDEDFLSPNNLPYAILIPAEFRKYPLESIHIQDSYDNYSNWVRSGFTSYKTWWRESDGNYLSDYIFNIDNIKNYRGFKTLTSAEWDTKAVRKVLHTFAYGGHQTEEQINTWANMNPSDAIKEMLNMDAHNYKLSPQDEYDKYTLSIIDNLTDLADHVTAEKGVKYYYEKWWETPSQSSIELNWQMQTALRGLNPFVSKIGLWETNYHMALSKKIVYQVENSYEYYDSIVQAHRDGKNYEDVMSIAATNKAIASQYGHYSSKYFPSSDTFVVNDDFAREYHQLFFCNFGEYNPIYHEETTIKNTAKALTGILDDSNHYPNVLEIYNQDISGDNFINRVNNLSKVAINHEESLKNLPVYIISSLADDNLSEETKELARNEWANMNSKNLVEFIQNYAISGSFHSKDRIKYQSTIDRSTKFWSKISTSNFSYYLSDFYYPFGEASNEGVRPFWLKHDVFGHQTGVESVNSLISISKNISGMIRLNNMYARNAGWKDGEVVYEKDWSSRIPKNSDGVYKTKDIAEFIWNDLIGDELAEFGELERAYAYACLNYKELSAYLGSDDVDKVWTLDELQKSENRAKIEALANKEFETLPVWSVNITYGLFAMMPQMFVQKGD